MSDNSPIHSYHAHVYYEPATRDVAQALRQRIGERFSVQLGRWHDVPVGPHSAAMYQVAFASEAFAAFVPWLMLNRQGLSVLVHPNTDRERDGRGEVREAVVVGDVHGRGRGAEAAGVHPRLVLAALSLAHDLEEERARREALERKTRDSVRRMLVRVDHVLEELPEGRTRA